MIFLLIVKRLFVECEIYNVWVRELINKTLNYLELG